ncbi:MAG: LptF/LptG family permease, partial [Bacteroidales bacterium]|nr:LptF/LptG family permease [Bacteroidales bacterium]
LTFRNSYSENIDSISELISSVYIAPIDSILLDETYGQQSSIIRGAITKAESNNNEFMFRSMSKVQTKRTINRHWVEWHRKFTLSFACLIFFFIGAPLGSIIRKGGMGMPIVVSVVLFIIYYILDNVGYKMTRDGVWIHWVGMWFSSFVLLPLGVFLTYKAMNDSVILNADAYLVFVKKIFFIREHRNYPVKEVIISPPVYSEVSMKIDGLNNDIDAYLKNYKSMGYKAYWFDEGQDLQFAVVRSKLEVILSSLSNSINGRVLDKAEEYPILISSLRPFKAGSPGAKILAYALPIGLVIRLVSLLFERRLNNDLLKVKKLNNELQLITDKL